MLKTNKLRFFKILEKALKPLKTLNKVKKRHDDCSEKNTLQSIADTFNVSKKLILLIKQNKIWRHVK